MSVGYSIFILLVFLSLLGISDVSNADRLSHANGLRVAMVDTVNNGSKAEKEAIPNRSLRGFDVIDDIKGVVERVCPNVFRRALWNVALGRRDGIISLANETNGNIPGPFSNFSTLLQLFNSKGLDVYDLVVLSAGIGVAHCGGLSRRLYNFTGKGDADPSLDPEYADILRAKSTVEMDPSSSLSFDKHYYDILRQNKGLSMRKMTAIDVLTGDGDDGQIRHNCRLINPSLGFGI
ncbi:hypothetical protein GQ457_01G021860 [Hibiscus cannabinus]